MKNYKELLFKKHDQFDAAANGKQLLLLRFKIKNIIETIPFPDEYESKVR